MKKIIMLACWFLGIMLLVALLSYHQDDQAWSLSTSDGAVQNSFGIVGAWCADVVFYFLGYSGYFLPVFLFLAGWRMFRMHEQNRPFDMPRFYIQILGVVLFFASCAGLIALHFNSISSPVYQTNTPGGIIGTEFADFLHGLFNYFGSVLVLLYVVSLSISICGKFSWLELTEYVGKHSIILFHKLCWACATLAELWQFYRIKNQRRQLVREDIEASKDRIQPEINITSATLDPKVDIDQQSEREIKESQTSLFVPDTPELPRLHLLDTPPPKKNLYSEETLAAISRQVEMKLKDFGIVVHVIAVYPGPVITCFELEPATGVKVSQISNLSKDIARSLSVTSVRVVDIIPGKPYVGLEIPNEQRELIVLREIVDTDAYESCNSPLALALGKDIAGKPIVEDLAKMPHLLVAGTTGSGKSVALNAMILSLLYKATPDKVKMIMIDPKMLELSVYQDIPHLLAPVVTDVKKAANALNWCVLEMERRYKLMAELGVRNINGYNRKIDEFATNDDVIDLYSEDSIDHQNLSALPLIVIIIDELADMMMVVGKKVEELIARLAQKARAAGIHLILATQRPSVDVITGLIKANIPSRIAFQVSSKIDSRTILDQMGAESLLGNGDMLFLPPGSSVPLRVHGAFLSDDEVHQVVTELKASGTADYVTDILKPLADTEKGSDGHSSEEELDPLYEEAVSIVIESKKTSISYLQRRLQIGYNRAARLVESMEQNGVVSPPERNGNRHILNDSSSMLEL